MVTSETTLLAVGFRMAFGLCFNDSNWSDDGLTSLDGRWDTQLSWWHYLKGATLRQERTRTRSPYSSSVSSFNGTTKETLIKLSAFHKRSS
jgi:hypothetical protein